MATASQSSNDDLVGPVLEVLPKLLAECRVDEVLEAVRALVARNEQLETTDRFLETVKDCFQVSREATTANTYTRHPAYGDLDHRG